MARRILLPLLLVLLLVDPARATWSIVCVDLRTREVGVASATCLANFNLRTGVPVVYVGEGAAAAQSFLDFTGANRRLIFESFRDTEETPAEILARLDDHDASFQSRQYGIVNFVGDSVTFTGRRDGPAATGVAGRVGDVYYSIQGNVLTGDPVVFAAEAAFRATKGDMGQKIMAAMEAARALGGDGRCSCSEDDPTSCGVPPPTFDKSAHVSVAIVARVGDTNGACNANQGCAQGQYYMNLNIVGGVASPDPVIVLKRRYDEWRAHLADRPDEIHSRVTAKALPADGQTVGEVVLELRDIEDERIVHGGAEIQIETVDGSVSDVLVGPVSDHGDGRYSFPVKAGRRANTERFYVRVIDTLPSDPTDFVTATLWPPLEITTTNASLYSASDSFSAAAGGTLGFVVNRRDKPDAPYMLVARLKPQHVLRAGAPAPSGVASALALTTPPFWPAGPLVLDANGRAECALDVPPAAFAALAGRRIEVTGYVLDGTPLETTNAVVVEVDP